MIRIKICGITRGEDARRASELGAWAVGLIFVPSSPRCLSLERARELRGFIRSPTLAIGVFADAPPARILRAASACRLDAAQLHGEETPEACASLGLPVYKAIGLSREADLERLSRYAGRAAGFLVETVRRLPEGRERLGEEERRARWALARRASAFGSVLLAGELSPGNVGEAVRLAAPAGVDVSGGVESAPGVKDPAMLEAFFRAVQEAMIRKMPVRGRRR